MLSDAEDVLVEQFGDRYLTVFNAGRKPCRVRLRVLSGKTPDVEELVVGGDWRADGGILTAELPPEAVRVLRFKSKKG